MQRQNRRFRGLGHGGLGTFSGRDSTLKWSG
jgi:hypothetical protein